MKMTILSTAAVSERIIGFKHRAISTICIFNYTCDKGIYAISAPKDEIAVDAAEEDGV